MSAVFAICFWAGVVVGGFTVWLFMKGADKALARKDEEAKRHTVTK